MISNATWSNGAACLSAEIRAGEWPIPSARGPVTRTLTGNKERPWATVALALLHRTEQNRTAVAKNAVRLNTFEIYSGKLIKNSDFAVT